MNGEMSMKGMKKLHAVAVIAIMIFGAIAMLPKPASAEGGTGGTITTDGAYTVHTFTSDGTFNSGSVTNISLLVVAGGGGGAGGGTGNGGSGVVIIRDLTPDSCTPTANQNWAITASDNCTIVGQVYNVKNITCVGSGNITFTHSNVTYDFMGRSKYCGVWKSSDSILAGRMRAT